MENQLSDRTLIKKTNMHNEALSAVEMTAGSTSLELGWLR